MNHSNQRNILLFIDDEKICHTLVDLIIPNFTNLKLVSAFNGEEAIDLAKRYANNIAVILTDIVLPGINGFEIYDTLKANPKFASIPFIFQSGLSNQEDELVKHIKDRRTKILYKPYKQKEFLEAVNDSIKVWNDFDLLK